MIELRGLRVLGTHGVLEEEQRRAQPFELDLDLDVDLAEAGATDALEDTVDYGAVTQLAVDLVGGAHSYALLEALATRIADEVLATQPRVRRVRVVLRKLRPPLPADIASVGVVVERGRSS